MSKIPKEINTIINDFTKKVNEALGDRVKKIILYGSYARGDFSESSDIDIMILTDFTDNEIIEEREKVWDIAYDIELDNNFDITLSPLVKNIDKFNYWLEAMPFYMNVQKEGVILSES
ncbi:MAG: nucleotidyltransferase domain-containing protein [Bacilli bacterium]|nr:nucleotidyltransferase domain-containing protein [Bacilli bacterium]